MLSDLKFSTEVKKADQASTVLGKTVRAGAGIELVSDVRPAPAASR